MLAFESQNGSKGQNAMMCWVAYRKGSFWLKERYPCSVSANARAIMLCAQTDWIELVEGNDPEGLAHIETALELPAPVRG